MVNRKTKDINININININKVAEGLVTTVEVLEAGVDSLCAQEWEEVLNMDHHLEIWAVELPGWDTDQWQCRGILLLECHLFMESIPLFTIQ